jgi:oligopeptide transport system ATP-binding protein
MSDAPLLEIVDLAKTFTSGGHAVAAVKEVSFTLATGESLGIVGESGSGKTTIARMLMGLERPSAGRILLEDEVLGDSAGAEERRRRARSMQMVFQDPFTSLDPRQRVGDGIDEIQRVHFDRSAAERAERTAALLHSVGLGERHANARPRRLSGGQRQRVAIARALATEPRIVILDEAVSALDVSIQAQILNLLADLRAELGVAYIVITHDLAVVRQIADRCLVMHRGDVVEAGTVDEILGSPREAYTRRLIASVPRPESGFGAVEVG